MPPTILRLGHPSLRDSAAPVNVEELKRGGMKALVSDLLAALAATAGSALTAPQLGVGLQVVALRLEGETSGKEGPSLQVVVNPMLEPEHGDLVYDWEGCLSVPGLKGLVPRYPTVRLRGVDENARPVDMTAEGEVARLLQHAHDHLSGVVFLDRMRDLRSLAFREEWEQFLREPAAGSGGPDNG